MPNLEKIAPYMIGQNFQFFEVTILGQLRWSGIGRELKKSNVLVHTDTNGPRGSKEFLSKNVT